MIVSSSRRRRRLRGRRQKKNAGKKNEKLGVFSERILSNICDNILFVELQPRELENEYRYVLKYVVALNLIKIRK